MGRPVQRGFTFVEVLIAVLITGLLMTSLYGLLYSTIQVKEIVQTELDGEKAGALAFDMLRKDLRAACALGEDRHFLKAVRGRAGGSRGGAGRIDFISSSRNRFPDESAFKERGEDREKYTEMSCDLCEIGYKLKSIDGKYALIRREDFYVDEDLEAGGVSMIVCRGVKQFEMTFFEGDEDETGETPEEEWDAEEKEALPFAVKVRLVIDRGKHEGDETEKVFEAVIPIHAGKQPLSEEDQELEKQDSESATKSN